MAQRFPLFRPLSSSVLLPLLVLSVAGCRSVTGVGGDDTSGRVPQVQDSGESTDTGGETDLPDTGVEDIPDADHPSEEIFSGETLPVFTIVVSRENANLLAQETSSSEHVYREATFIYNDREYTPVGIRLKGENSFESFRNKPSFKVKFDKYEDQLRFLELNGITLNNMNDDYSMMHERVAYRVYREFGVPSYRANHALVYVQEVEDDVVVSDRFYGVYTLLEDADRDLIRRWFEDEDGSLYEIWDVDFYDQYVMDFQLEYGEDDRTNIQGTADAMELTGERAFEEADEHLHIEDFLKFWAVGGVVAQFDGYPYSSPGDDCHVYDDPTTGKLWFMPHGADETFYYPTSSLTSVNGIVAQRCLQVQWCTEQMKSYIWDVMETNEEWDWVTWFDEIQDQISEYVEQDQNKSYSTQTVRSYQSEMRDFISQRRTTLTQLIGPDPEE